MKKHIIPHSFQVDAVKRSDIKGHKPMLLWFTGLSGSGKSTIANAVEVALNEKGIHTYLLDGDNVRAGLNGDLGFSSADREENIRRIGEVANLMVDAGLVVLASFVSPFRSDRERVKKTVGQENYVEVYVNTPLEECERRDVKGLYKKARAGEIADFTGISSPYEAPVSPDIDIETKDLSVPESAQIVVDAVMAKLSKA
jgi:adenylyl-sulfate kinase